MVEPKNDPSAGEPPSMGETLAVLLARDMADGEKAIIGTNSDMRRGCGGSQAQAAW
jgi:hypothetical protein